MVVGAVTIAVNVLLNLFGAVVELDRTNQDAKFSWMHIKDKRVRKYQKQARHQILYLHLV
jgi:hypothetical protein